MTEEVELKPVVLFDGACNLCTLGADFIRRHDGHGRLALVDGNENGGRALLRHWEHGAYRPDTLVLIDKGGSYVRSSAVIRLLAGLGGPWRLALLALLVPRTARDFAYDLIARNRHRLIGIRDC